MGNGSKGMGEGVARIAQRSDARRDSKRLETRSLAEDESNQQKLEKRSKCDVPEPSKLPRNHPKGPTKPLNPPRRRGRLKSRPKRIGRSKREGRLAEPYSHVEAKAGA